MFEHSIDILVWALRHTRCNYIIGERPRHIRTPKAHTAGSYKIVVSL